MTSKTKRLLILVMLCASAMGEEALARWTEAKNMQSVSDGRLVMGAAGSGGWGSTGASSESWISQESVIKGVSFTLGGECGGFMLGLSYMPIVNTGDYQEINRAMYAHSSSLPNACPFYVVERRIPSVHITFDLFGTYNANEDILRASINADNFVEYYVNQELRYTSVEPMQYPWRVAVSHNPSYNADSVAKNVTWTDADGNAVSIDSADPANPCTGVTCLAKDQCHSAGVCSDGECSDPAVSDDTECNDDDSATVNDVCKAGTCAGCAPGTAGPDCTCSISYDANSQPEPPKIVAGSIRLVGASLTLPISESVDFIKNADNKPKLTIKTPTGAVNTSPAEITACLAAFTWTLTENRCNDRVYSGSIAMADLTKCPYTKEDSADTITATWHFGVESARLTLVGGVGGDVLTQTLKSLRPVSIAFPKSVNIDNQNFTVQNALLPVLEIPFNVPCSVAEANTEAELAVKFAPILNARPEDLTITIKRTPACKVTVKVTADDDTTTEVVKKILDAAKKAPMKSAYSVGDPHFKDFNGGRFDCHYIDENTGFGIVNLFTKGNLSITAKHQKPYPNWRVAVNVGFEITFDGGAKTISSDGTTLTLGDDTATVTWAAAPRTKQIGSASMLRRGNTFDFEFLDGDVKFTVNKHRWNGKWMHQIYVYSRVNAAEPIPTGMFMEGRESCSSDTTVPDPKNEATQEQKDTACGHLAADLRAICEIDVGQLNPDDLEDGLDEIKEAYDDSKNEDDKTVPVKDVFTCPDVTCVIEVPDAPTEGFDVITVSGIVSTAVDYRAGGLTPYLDLHVFTKVQDPFKLQSGVHQSTDTELSYGVWAVDTATNTANDYKCAADGEDCKSMFKTEVDDPNGVCTFNGEYQVQFAVACAVGETCAVHGRGVTSAMRFQVNSGNHCPTLVDGVTLGGDIKSYVTDPATDATAAESLAFLNDEAIFFVGNVRTDQAALSTAEFTEIVLLGKAGVVYNELVLYEEQTPGAGDFAATADGSAVTLNVFASAPGPTDPAVDDSYLTPRFNLMTRMATFNPLSPDEGVFSVRATVAVTYAGVGAVRRRRLLTTTYSLNGRRLLETGATELTSEDVSIDFTPTSVSMASSAVSTLPAALQALVLASCAVFLRLM